MDSDNVSHPSHYTQGGVECIEAIEAALGAEGFAGYCAGNVIKYVWRYRHKNGVEDLRKAREYLDYMLASAEGSGILVETSNLESAGAMPENGANTAEPLRR